MKKQVPKCKSVRQAVGILDRVAKRGEKQGLCNSDAIAKYLSDRGIKGRVGECYSCPVALFIRRSTGKKATVEGSHIGKDNPCPQSIRHFIRAFDGRIYPELIR